MDLNGPYLEDRNTLAHMRQGVSHLAAVRSQNRSNRRSSRFSIELFASSSRMQNGWLGLVSAFWSTLGSRTQSLVR